jgi:putative spermidine/putrescine transport system ATP-binding protein
LLRLDGITRRYGAVAALGGVSLAVAAGEFLTLLGPSGSGKTTLLNIIAGFVAPDEGRIVLEGRDITALPAERRDFGMVFQGYALFPHMTVAENVAFALRVRGMGRAEREARVGEALDLVQLGGLGGRRPAQLSGGQQQRVALARALVFRPRLLLLDEPLSALDRQLRAGLQEELRGLNRRTGVTFVAVTHDQDEALSMSDRVAILREGRLVQLGPPVELYERPRTRFVAGFLGHANFLQTAAGLFALRPERIRLLGDGETAEVETAGRLEGWSFLGAGFELRVGCGGLGTLSVAHAAHGFVPAEGRELRLGWEVDATVPVEAD